MGLIVEQHVVDAKTHALSKFVGSAGMGHLEFEGNRLGD